jgi:endonuclease
LNIEQLEPGLKIADGGSEKIVPSGRIDITCEDQAGKTVVIELKAGTAARDAIAQILSYLGMSKQWETNAEVF